MKRDTLCKHKLQYTNALASLNNESIAKPLIISLENKLPTELTVYT